MRPRGVLEPEAIGSAFALERRPPPADLAEYVDIHWLVRWDLRGRPPFAGAVLPHPSVHLVFESGGTGVVHGVARGRFERRLSGAGWALGTKFRPGGFAPFATGPLSDLTDRVCELEEALGPTAVHLRQTALPADPTPAVALAATHRFLRLRLREAAADSAGAALVRRVAAAMLTAPPGTRVAELAAAHGVSERTLQRLFAAHVGVSPKWVLQRYRMHEALERIDAGGRVDWGHFALDLGYYDQAHFTRDFRRLAGRTPAQYGRRS